MLKRNLTRFFAVTMIVFMTYSVSFAADDTRYIRIKFSRGATSTQYRGNIKSDQNVCFELKAKNGQQLTASVSSDDGAVLFYLVDSEIGDENVDMTIDHTGDTELCVKNDGNTTNFFVNFEIH